MDLRLTPAEAAFRDRLRSWLDATLPTLPPKPDRDDWPARRAYDTAWQRLLFDAGYAGVDWPSGHGGLGASPTEQLIFLEETAKARAPYVGANFVGLLHAGPTLIVEGTEEQRAAHLKGILRGDEVWCQGFSEPDAGSDLASLRTVAVREGEEYVINGRKVWTSHAEVADYCELLVRTDPDAPRHKGITWLILPMDAPGVTVRPLRTAVGSSEFSELILDDVRVPVANRVGAENDGWRVAMVTFSFERGTAFISDVVESRNLLAETVATARATPAPGGGTLWDDGALRRDVGVLAAEVSGLWSLIRKNVSEASAGMIPVQGASVFKLKFTENRQRIGDLAAHVLGRASLAMSGPGGHVVEDRVNTLAFTIAAGTSQIQKNILAERVLGLPKEPRWT
ncbi:alkylation response protein AidB-like acyl-CoA dehydrogenase [Actinocorallia herbida]|uniref:Alkylation response protein AidB-like acyl-CoA dehydrogenase n=1 Tax=Actinocorallia herbida TaxID=58109 RepID=A0A3N1CUY9_9ACTN|nr:acyl-CoA dehydrogenase family protein [Actinocorallia herbida]ROO85044.1 alkylation response protein AidB-like acyl-CoA dehydrogenase [Actinocorallia herbida]